MANERDDAARMEAEHRHDRLQHAALLLSRHLDEVQRKLHLLVEASAHAIRRVDSADRAEMEAAFDRLADVRFDVEVAAESIDQFVAAAIRAEDQVEQLADSATVARVAP